MDATVTIHTGERLGPVRPTIFGTMLEDWGEAERHAIYGSIWVGEDSPIPNLRGLRRDVLEATRALGPTIIRWPGGCPADVYHWLDGVGPRAARPTTILPMHWSRGLDETNAFGTAEFLDFCRQVGAAPYLNTNVGTGSAEEAAHWVEYCNRRGRSRYAALRAAHGYPEPFDVRTWGIGNEQYGAWEVGHMDAAAYARTAFEYAKLMRMVDPSIAIVGVGCDRADWNTALLTTAGRDLDYISIHKYYQVEEYYPLVACPVHAEATFRRLRALLWALAPAQPQQASEEMTGLGGRWPLIAVDEWNLWHVEAGPVAFFQQLTLQDGLFSAGMFHAFLRLCDSIGMACICDLANSGPCGPLVVDERGLYVNPQGLVFGLYRHHIGEVVLRTDVDVPAYDAGILSALGERMPEPVSAVPYLDCVATSSADGTRLYLAAINRHREEAIAATIEIGGWAPQRPGLAHVLTAPEVTAANDFDHPERVRVVTQPCAGAPRMTHVFPPHSVTILEL